VNEEAERHFGLPASVLGYARARGAPLYEPSRDASN
jgi:hypothetical protein